MGYLQKFAKKADKTLGKNTSTVLSGGLNRAAGSGDKVRAEDVVTGGGTYMGRQTARDIQGGGERAGASSPLKDDPRVDTASGIPMPTAPVYKDPFQDAQNIYSAGQLDLGKNALDMSGIEAIKARALEQGDSPWAKMALQKQGLEQSALTGAAAQLSANQAAQARAGMAARGGLRGGAAMRLGNQAMQNQALARQGVLQQGALSRADIGLQDQLQKNQFLSQLPGAQLGAAQYKAGLEQFNIGQQNQGQMFNIGNRLAGEQQRLANEQFIYGEGMKRKAGAELADAIQNAGARSAWSKLADPAGIIG